QQRSAETRIAPGWGGAAVRFQRLPSGRSRPIWQVGGPIVGDLFLDPISQSSILGFQGQLRRRRGLFRLLNLCGCSLLSASTESFGWLLRSLSSGSFGALLHLHTVVDLFLAL